MIPVLTILFCPYMPTVTVTVRPCTGPLVVPGRLASVTLLFAWTVYG